MTVESPEGPLIIFDTSSLRGFNLNDSTADLLRVIRASGIEKVGAPWMVMEELAGQRVVKYLERHSRAAQALDSLGAITPWPMEPVLEAADPDSVRTHVRDQYATMIDVIPTSEAAMREALFREANGLPPCRTVPKGQDKHEKIGCRDAAIWLSAIEYARDHPDELVYFVSGNTRDFGDGSAHQYPMDRDLDGLRHQFEHLTSIEDVITRFTEDAEADVGRCQQILSGDGAASVVAQEAVAFADRKVGFGGFEVSRLSFDSPTEPSNADRVYWWDPPPLALFQGCKEPRAFKIGERGWCTVAANWLLVGVACVDSGAYASFAACCTWQVNLLVAMQDDAQPVVLRCGSTQAVSAQEWRESAGDVAAAVKRRLDPTARVIHIPPWARSFDEMTELEQQLASVLLTIQGHAARHLLG